jgi:hypothetical protein
MLNTTPISTPYAGAGLSTPPSPGGDYAAVIGRATTWIETTRQQAARTADAARRIQDALRPDAPPEQHEAWFALRDQSEQRLLKGLSVARADLSRLKQAQAALDQYDLATRVYHRLDAAVLQQR